MALRSSAYPIQALAGAAIAAAFGVTLLGMPSCATKRTASSASLRRAETLMAHGHYAEALPLALDSQRRDPADAAAAWQVARAYQGLGKPTDEASAWETYLKLSPPTGDVCLRLSEVYQSLRQPAQVVALANRCLALDERQVELLGDLAAASLELHDRPAAVSALKRALAIDPAHPQFRAQLQQLEGPQR